MALALFDLDETLIDGDSASLWLAYLVECGIATPALQETEARLMERYHRGDLDMREYMRCTLAPLLGLSAEWLAQQCQHYCESWLRPRLYGEGVAKIEWHRQRGDTLVLISATGEHLVAPMARMLGMDHCLAIQLERHHDGALTGNTVGTLTFREGKVARIREIFGEASAGSFGYSDSMNDLPMLEWVDHPHATNPSASLREVASARHWPIYDWTPVAPR